MSPRIRWIVLASLVVVNLLVITIGGFTHAYLALEIVAGQTSLLALWAALGTEVWVVRWPRVCLIAALQTEAFCLGLSMQTSFSDFMIFCLLSQSAAVILGMAALSCGIGWLWPLRIQPINGAEHISTRSVPKLTIRRLLAWTAIIGALLAAARMMDSPNLSQLRSPDPTLNPFLSSAGILMLTWCFAEYTVLIIAASLPWIYATLARRRFWIWHAGALVYWGLLVVVEAAIPWKFYAHTWQDVLELNLVIAAVVVLNLHVVRACGFRLMPIEPHRES